MITGCLPAPRFPLILEIPPAATDIHHHRPGACDCRQRANEIKRQDIYGFTAATFPWSSLNAGLPLPPFRKGVSGSIRNFELTKRATAKSAGGTGSPSTLHFDAEDQGIRPSAEAITELASVPHPILILHHPMVTECLAHKSDAIFQHFMQAGRQRAHRRYDGGATAGCQRRRDQQMVQRAIRHTSEQLRRASVRRECCEASPRGVKRQDASKDEIELRIHLLN